MSGINSQNLSWRKDLEIVARRAISNGISWNDFGKDCREMYFKLALEHCDGSQTMAARHIGIGRTTLLRKTKSTSIRSGLRELEAAALDLSVAYQRYAVKVQPEKLDEAVRRVIEQVSKER